MDGPQTATKSGTCPPSTRGMSRYRLKIGARSLRLNSPCAGASKGTVSDAIFTSDDVYFSTLRSLRLGDRNKEKPYVHSR